MKKILLIAFWLGLSFTLNALDGEIVYVEGTVDIKYATGDLDWADIGMYIETGDSIVTGYDGYVELEMEDGSTVKVSEDSIFALSSYESQGSQKNSFNCVLGSVQYKFTQAVKANEPRITTPATVCGIRGTEFTVVSGLDGSALYVVDDGSVAVSAQGEEVVLGAMEGVEVAPGSTPGEPFPVLRGQIDYSKVRSEAEQRFLENPAASMRIMISQLEEYITEIKKYEKSFKELSLELISLRETLFSLEGEAKNLFYKENLEDKDSQSSYLKLNMRYFAVSSLSLRRHLVGNMYVNIRTKYMGDTENPVYVDFVREYYKFLDLYEKALIPYLVDADI